MILALLACNSDSDLHRIRHAPEAAITYPAEGAVLRLNEGPFLAQGTVEDDFTSGPDLTVTWTLDGTEAAGSADSDGLSSFDMVFSEAGVGDHELALRVVDQDAQDAEASVHFSLLGPREAPVVTITAPADGSGFTSSDSIAFQGEATDSVTPAADLLMAWSIDGSPLEGAVSANGISIVVSALPVGEHVVALTATDSDGDVGADEIAVTVADLPVEAEPGDLVFSEMMIDPSVADDEVGEWVELYNTSGSPIDIGGYTFRDDDVDSYELTGSIVVAPNDYVVLCASTDTAVNGGVPCDAAFVRDYRGNGLALANGEDEVVLARPDGTEIDWLHYDETWYEVAIALGVDPAFQDAGNNDDASHWCNQTTVVSAGGEPGTPGLPNDACP